jgi:hypothetical protein
MNSVLEKQIKKFLPKSIEKAFEKQGDTSELEAKDIKTILKIFNPTGGHTWYLYERLDEDVFMCYVTGTDFPELGTVSISELASLRGMFNLPMERDRHYTGENLQELISRTEAEMYR